MIHLFVTPDVENGNLLYVTIQDHVRDCMHHNHVLTTLSVVNDGFSDRLLMRFESKQNTLKHLVVTDVRVFDTVEDFNTFSWNNPVPEMSSTTVFDFFVSGGFLRLYVEEINHIERHQEEEPPYQQGAYPPDFCAEDHHG